MTSWASVAAERLVSAGDWAFAIVFFLAAFGLCGWAWYEVHRRRARWTKVPGVVTGLVWERGRIGGAGPDALLHPVLRFRTLDGREIESRSESGATPCPVRPGQSVTVCYDPADPAKAAPAELLAFSAVGVVLVAIVFAVIGAGFVWFLLSAP